MSKKIEVLPVPRSAIDGEIYVFQVEVYPTERIRITPSHFGDHGTFTIATRTIEEAESVPAFGYPKYDGELDKFFDYEMLRSVLKSGEIDEIIYNKLKETATPREKDRVFNGPGGA